MCIYAMRRVNTGVGHIRFGWIINPFPTRGQEKRQRRHSDGIPPGPAARRPAMPAMPAMPGSEYSAGRAGWPASNLSVDRRLFPFPFL